MVRADLAVIIALFAVAAVLSVVDRLVSVDRAEGQRKVFDRLAWLGLSKDLLLLSEIRLISQVWLSAEVAFVKVITEVEAFPFGRAD